MKSKYYIHNFDGNLIGPDEGVIDYNAPSFRHMAYEFDSEQEAKEAHGRLLDWGHGGVVSDDELDTSVLRSRLMELADSPAMSPVLTWDGAHNWDVQPDPKLCPLTDGQVVILSRESLMEWCGQEWDNDDCLDDATEWVQEDQQVWYEEATT